MAVREGQHRKGRKGPRGRKDEGNGRGREGFPAFSGGAFLPIEWVGLCCLAALRQTRARRM